MLGYEPWQGSNQQSTEDGCESNLKSRTDDSDSAGTAPAAARSKVLWKVTDGLACALNFLEMDASSRMAVDHATTSYYALLGLEYEF